MWLPSKDQIDSAKRHAAVAAGVAFTILGLQAKGVSMDQVTALINSLGEVANTAVQLAAAASVAYGVVKGFIKASPTSQIAAVQAIATDPAAPSNKDAKAALLDATASLPEVVGEIKVTDKDLETATTSPQVKAV